MLPYVAVVIIVLFIAAAFAIDIASMHVVRSELRTATDGAARAAVEALGREQSRDAAIAAALRVAEANNVAGTGLQLDVSKIQLGSSGQNPDGSFFFNEEATPLNAARVTGERTDSSPGGAVGLFFGQIFGVSEFQPVQTATATRLDRDIALVLDVSGSMRNHGRIEGLRNALDVFLTELDQTSQKERLSLTVYSTQERKVQELTSDLQLIRDAFAREIPEGFTAIGAGLSAGIDSVANDPGARPFALKSVIVMTDGKQNRGTSPDLVVGQAVAAGVVVHTITFSEGANQALMRDVADEGNGIHLHAEDDDELLESFKTIANQLQVLLIE